MGNARRNLAVRLVVTTDTGTPLACDPRAVGGPAHTRERPPSPSLSMSRAACLRRPATLTTLTTLTLLAALSAGGCKKGDSTGPRVARALIIVQGNAQVRQAYRKLPTPLVLRATDDDGRGVPNVPVTLVVDQGGGAVDSASVTTDGNGEARVRWTLGGTPTQSLVASAPGVPSVRATATILLPTDVVIVQGNNQTARAGTALPVPVVVRVLGAGNVAMDSMPVALQIASGGGTVSPQTVVTSAAGEATVKWTLGAAGPNTAYLRVGSLEPTILTATATP